MLQANPPKSSFSNTNYGRCLSCGQLEMVGICGIKCCIMHHSIEYCSHGNIYDLEIKLAFFQFFRILYFYLKRLLEMRIFNFVNFENLIYMKVYSLLILKKIQKYKKDGC